LVILIINYFTSLIFSGELVRQNDFVVQRKLETIISDMHEKLAIVRSMSFELQQDKNITSLLLQDESQLRYGRTDEEKIRISQLFQDYAARSKLINKIILIDKNENILDLEYANKEFKELVLKDEQYLAFS
jgi:hypothetical protein